MLRERPHKRFSVGDIVYACHIEDFVRIVAVHPNCYTVVFCDTPEAGEEIIGDDVLEVRASFVGFIIVGPE